MPAPIFDVLAQTEVAPTGNAQTIYTPPAGRAAVIAGVRVVSKWPSAERVNAHPSYTEQRHMIITFYRQDPYGEVDVFGGDNSDFQTRDNYWKQLFLSYQDTIQYKVPQYTEQSGYQKRGSLSLFKMLVGNSPVTGLVITPLPTEHLDVKVPILSNQKPLKIINGIVTRYRNQSDKTSLQTMLENHRRRCPTLDVTVFGQLVDNT